MKRGQVSVEYIIIIGIILVITIPLFYYAIREPSRSLKANQAADTVNVLARKADSIAALGPGSRDYVWISIPGSVTNVLIGNRSVSLHLSDLGDITAYTHANVTGFLPIAQGTYRVVVENLENLVYIGPINDTTPPIVTATAPSGVVTTANPELSATTNEPARCKFSTSDTLYDTMPNTFTGAGIIHTYQLSNQAPGAYAYYVRCRDNANNTMTTSATISFTISLDTTLPVIQGTNANPRDLTVDNTICINASVTDNAGVSAVWAILTVPLATPPYTNVVNITLLDTGASCALGANDNIYGALHTMQVPGASYINTTFANDTAGNLASQLPWPTILINVTANTGFNPSQGLTIVPVSLAAYLKSPSTAINTADSAMSQNSNMTLDLTDDDKNTPPSTNKFKWSNSFWEGFSFTLNKKPSDVSIITLRLKVVDSDILPYNLTVYTYLSDLNTINMQNVTFFQVREIAQAGVTRGINEITITNTVKSSSNNTLIKVRVVPNGTEMSNKVMHISEADFGIF